MCLVQQKTLQRSNCFCPTDLPLDTAKTLHFYDFFLEANILALAAFFLLLLIMTMARKDPTIAEPRSVRMTGILIAHTREGKKLCKG